MTFIHQMVPVFDEADQRSVADCIASGWTSEGPRTKEFERRIARIMGAKHGIATNNGSIALYLALRAALKARKIRYFGTHVSDLTFVATAEATQMANGTGGVCLDDIRTDDFCTASDVSVALNGRDPRGGKVVDAAQALGSKVHLGEAASLSFAPNKLLTTGQGGMVLTDSDEMAEQVRRLKDHGRLNKADYHPSPGFNYKFSDLQAALGLSQLDKLPKRIQHKKAICRQYRDELEGVDGVEIPEAHESELLLWFDILVQGRDKVQARLLKRFEVETRAFYRPLHTQPSFRTEGKFPNATRISSLGLWLPSSSDLQSEDISFICASIKSALR